MDEVKNQWSGAKRLLWISLSTFGIIATGGFIVGFVTAAPHDGSHTFSAIAVAILAVAVLLIVALGYVTWRNAKAMKVHGEDLNSRERRNREILSICIFIGAMIGLGFAYFDLSQGNMPTTQSSLFSNTPLPLTAALWLAFGWAIVMPVVVWWWHKTAIDEQEASAYRDGSLAAGYAYLIGAPTWWMLWRGGLLPEPNGVAIFMTFCLIWTVVWFWKKYR